MALRTRLRRPRDVKCAARTCADDTVGSVPTQHLSLVFAGQRGHASIGPALADLGFPIGFGGRRRRNAEEQEAIISAGEFGEAFPQKAAPAGEHSCTDMTTVVTAAVLGLEAQGTPQRFSCFGQVVAPHTTSATAQQIANQIKPFLTSRMGGGGWPFCK
jgi:hypothetical protein